MQWKPLFQKYIIERGRIYYKQKSVKNLKFDGNSYTAKVLGTRVYNVKIKVEEDNILEMHCSCPYAKSGIHCKHMAAVLFAIEKDMSETQPEMPITAQEKIQPFQPVTDHYQYFDLAKILNNLTVTRTLYDSARQLIEKQQTSLDKVEIGFNSYFSYDDLICSASGSYKVGTKLYPVTVICTKDSVLRASCSVPRCGQYWGTEYYSSESNMCKHLLSFFILLDEHLKEYNPGDTTDLDGLSLLRDFRAQQKQADRKQLSNVQYDLSFEPTFENDYGDLSLSFRSGLDRLYVVKDLMEFMELYENGETITFGKKTMIDFSVHKVAESANATFEYVRNILKQTDEHNDFLHSQNNYYYTEVIKNHLPLYGERLDQFFDLYAGKELPYNQKNGYRTEKSTIKFRDGNLNLSLTIKKDVDKDNVFHGIQVSGNAPSLLQGRSHYYYFDQDTLFRVSADASAQALPLMKLVDHDQLEFHVGRKSLSEFYHHVLPVLKENFKIREVDSKFIHSYIPPKAAYCFYLDAENGKLICRPKVNYGETEVSLLDNHSKKGRLEDFRNPLEESDVLSMTEQFFSDVDLDADELYCEENEDSILNVLENGISQLMSAGEVHTTDRFRGITIRKKPTLKVGVSLESDIMNLSISSDDLTPEELIQILQSYQRKKKYYRLKSGSLIEVEENDMETIQQMMETLKLSAKEILKGNMKVPLYRALYLYKMLEQNDSIYLNRDKHFRNLIREFKTTDDSSFEAPESLQSKLRNYQVSGFRWMKTLSQYGFGGILADDMGLGKTLQMITVLLDAKENGQDGTSLIVCPASLVYNWKEEFQKFAPELNVTMITGTQADRAELLAHASESDVLITSYDLLKRDIAEYDDKTFLYQVLDEAQYIKNHSTAAAKAAKVIHSRYRFALTGTPIENRLSELWSIFDYLMPGFLYGYETFRKELETPIVKSKDEAASERLKKMISPFILRRLKGDVLKDLPDKIEEIRYAKLEPEQQKLYDGQVVHMKDVIAKQDDQDFQSNKLQILAELTRIRQLCCDPELLFEKYSGGSAKRAACIDLIQSAIEGEHKILVFSQFTSMLALLEQDLSKNGISYYKITGETPKQKRVELVNAFNGDETPVFLISLKAGGTGLNLTGADVVIHYDPWWNQAVQNQATDRAHRIGQTKIVSVYKLIAKDTIEEKIVKMQETKRDLADSMLNGEMGGIAQLSKDDLLALL